MVVNAMVFEQLRNHRTQLVAETLERFSFGELLAMTLGCAGGEPPDQLSEAEGRQLILWLATPTLLAELQRRLEIADLEG